MHNHEPHDYTCPFCQIVAGEPTERGDQKDDIVLQDDRCTAFVAGKWWHKNPGHVLIVPNEHIENLYDMPNDVGHAIFDASKKIAHALKDVYGCEGVSTRQHNEPAGNQSVWHYHLHVFPRYKDDKLYTSYHDSAHWPTPEDRRAYAEKLKAYFENNR
ncbi:MAG TPA: HIT family protein [Candidatus Paceibacterota bacterium]|nr:HIT family protein [Candidatus Paceibacterota bacterium]